ncbi:D-methionine transport system substrate-binding protein [Desulfonispora thiosulfatigenes DSM 11270]|uniref:Lipoprotein n=1 Tax=Desulfonispora thiosulfatigenes DSM 11270 TaxID=656914 RepID=A0A1W1UQS5_DESTI|nr:MetQ/NlpA family ABC transporter substrate-binding protein [Desulfonispora thiosulfatigenes]SMB83383.1 D-methionine transport system substrate-binding protein [Desulfonispora thiosulfatigenes DSM 11270]
MNFKKIISITIILLLAVSLVGCGGQDAPKENADGAKVIKVGASPTPHADILEKAGELLKEKGYELKVTEFTDYVMPNTALDEGSIDANYFQHLPYLEDFNKSHNLDLVSAVKVHFEPLGIYSANLKSLEELKDGDKIAVPNDPSNEARALLLLESAGLIKVDSEKGLNATPQDIENPRNFQIVELEAASLSTSLEDVSLAVINGNYAIDADLNPAKDALASEEKTSLAADTFANIIAVKNETKDSDSIKALVEVLTSPEMKKFIEEKYEGAVIPVF